MKRFLAVLFLTVFLSFGCANAKKVKNLKNRAQPRLQTVNLTIGTVNVTAEVAATPEQQKKGLMFRKKLGKSEGMLFPYAGPAYVCMWMKNTLIPLSVAFIGVDGKILNIEDMEPKTENSHCGNGAVLFALEMNKGWFEKHNIGIGSEVSGLPMQYVTMSLK